MFLEGDKLTLWVKNGKGWYAADVSLRNTAECEDLREFLKFGGIPDCSSILAQDNIELTCTPTSTGLNIKFKDTTVVTTNGINGTRVGETDKIPPQQQLPEGWKARISHVSGKWYCVDDKGENGVGIRGNNNTFEDAAACLAGTFKDASTKCPSPVPKISAEPPQGIAQPIPVKPSSGLPDSIEAIELRISRKPPVEEFDSEASSENLPNAVNPQRERRLTQHLEPELESHHLAEISLFSSVLAAGGYLIYRCLRPRRPKGPILPLYDTDVVL